MQTISFYFPDRTAYRTHRFILYVCMYVCNVYALFSISEQKSYFSRFCSVLFCSYARMMCCALERTLASLCFSTLLCVLVCVFFFALLCLSAWYDIHLNHPSNSYTRLMGRLCCWCFRWIERGVLLLLPLLLRLLLLLLPLFQTHFEHACNNLMIHFTVSSLCNTTNQYTNFAVRWITLSRWNRWISPVFSFASIYLSLCVVVCVL